MVVEKGKNPREPRHRDWIKLYVKECLLGTIREDLSPEERGTWYDFLILAGNSRVPGVICANRNTAYSKTRIAQILNIPEDLLARCMKKFEDSGRIRVRKGLIYIINWAKYQYSDYDRQAIYREAYHEQQQEVKGSGPGDFAKVVEEMRAAYPHLDIDNELVKFNHFWSEEGKGKHAPIRPKIAFRNWVERIGKFQPKQPLAGKPTSKHPGERMEGMTEY